MKLKQLSRGNKFVFSGRKTVYIFRTMYFAPKGLTCTYVKFKKDEFTSFMSNVVYSTLSVDKLVSRV